MNAPAPIARPATYRDLAAAPPHMVAELIGGALHLQPRPRPRHALAALHLGAEIGAPFSRGTGGGPGGWVILVEPELHLGEDVLVPDLAGWRKERLTPFPEETGIAVPPDWACEILSPSTRRLDLTLKRDICAREGVAHLWFVDPDARTLEAFGLEGGRWVLLSALAGDAPVALAPFAAVSFPLGALWPD